MLLAIDLGNTNIVIGVFRKKQLLYHWRLTTRECETADEFAITFKNLLDSEGIMPAQIRKIIIASVVPPLQDVLVEMSDIHFHQKPIIITNEIVDIPVLYNNPREVGADRLVNAKIGYQKYGGPLIIVDFGTATTFCVISSKGEYLGGVIAPGINISAEALSRHTAKLPRVEIGKPPQVIGKTTANSIQSGLYYGYAALVDGLVERIQTELGEKTRVVATGGLARFISPETQSIQKTDPWLTLEGLCLIAHKESSPATYPDYSRQVT